jgi:hypothetical protein
LAENPFAFENDTELLCRLVTAPRLCRVHGRRHREYHRSCKRQINRTVGHLVRLTHSRSKVPGEVRLSDLPALGSSP